MNIVHCFFTMETGGSQILAVDLLNEMCTDHNTSLIIVNNKFNKSLIDKLDNKTRVHYLNRMEGSRNPLPILKLNFLLWHLRPDVIHCHEPKMATAIKFKKAKLIYTIHDVGIKPTYFGLYDTLVAISDAVAIDVKYEFKYPIKTIYNGIAANCFKRRKEYFLNGDKIIRLVQVSRLVHEKKGQDVLINALKIVKEEYGYKNFVLDIIGSGESFSFLNDLVVSNAMEENVIFLGEKDRNWIYDNLCNYNFLVQPSRYEGFGLTLIEGFAAGLLVLGSDIEGPLEIISKSARGFSFRSEDKQDCAKMLDHLFQKFIKNEVNDLINTTQNIADTVYSIKNCANSYLLEYAS